MRIVLDTNVLVAGLLNTRGAPGSVVNSVLDGRVSAVVDDRILFEYRDVLRWPKFRFEPQYVESILDFLEHASEKVTGNLPHFPEKSNVISPAAFVSMLQGNEQA